jgi:glycosyltransferase involved in cell wall biosynthesis
LPESLGAAIARALAPISFRKAIRNKADIVSQYLKRPFDYRRTIHEAIESSHQLSRLIQVHMIDALFGVCISTDLYAVKTHLPIIYASDATAHLINTTYPIYMARSHSYHRACDEIERRALHKVSLGLFASQATRESAIEHYQFPPDRAFVAPFGATVTPRSPVGEPDPPTRDKVELVLVAADPVRKRLDLCIDVAELLDQRGFRVRLNYVGPYRRRARRSPLVKCAGPLRLSDAADRDCHDAILRRSHLMLLPSIGEMFGIAPCEAAHFGRPSIVSDVGGLPSVVQHNRTGLVLPRAAPASEYADAIEMLCRDRERYRALSVRAVARAHEALNWDAWGRTAAPLIRETVDKSLETANA